MNQQFCFFFLSRSFHLFLAAQSWCLAVNLPVLIGEWVPADDEHYYCYLTLLAILAICVATSVTAEDACLLTTMIADYHQRFRQLYPDQPVTPKMHYMVHLPSQLLRYSLKFNVTTVRCHIWFDTNRLQEYMLNCPSVLLSN